MNRPLRERSASPGAAAVRRGGAVRGRWARARRVVIIRTLTLTSVRQRYFSNPYFIREMCVKSTASTVRLGMCQMRKTAKIFVQAVGIYDSDVIQGVALLRLKT